MPRTKAVRRGSASQDSFDSSDEILVKEKKDLQQKITEFEDHIQAAKDAVKTQFNSTIQKIREFYTNLQIHIQNAGIANFMLKELRNMEKSKDGCATESSKHSQRKGTAHRKHLNRSNSCSSRPVSKKTDRLRSISCDRVKKNVHYSASKVTTPLNFNSSSPPIVTPKVNPNQAVAILRRPRLGEFAVSISGSPLMVSGVSHDDMVSVSIPLSDGRILSILPTDGIDATGLTLDEETRDQLKKLRQNLNKCLAK